MLHLVTVLALVREFGGDNKALRSTMHDMRRTLPKEVQPLAYQLTRHHKIDKWLDTMLAYYCPEGEPDGTE